MRNLTAGMLWVALITGGAAFTNAGAQSRSHSDAAAEREAVRFERTKDAAGRRQINIEASRRPQASAAGKAAAEGNSSVGAAVNFERAKDAAAARQARLEARRSGEYSTAANHNNSR